MNHWTATAALADAFVREGTSVAIALICRTLAEQVPTPGAVLDIGGGDAVLALHLAAAGHTVAVHDIDPRMIALGRARLAQAPDGLARRVRLACAPATDASPRAADLVCCHSVLMYEDDPAPMVRAAVRACRVGGHVSIVAVDPAAIAMRPGLAGCWAEAVDALETGAPSAARYAPSRNHPRAEVERLLAAAGARTVHWSGIGIFTDHSDGPIDTDDPDALLAAEWLAGQRDPYRRVARCYHLIALVEREA
jgi:S-adenosylmethionine-dependent methyltransferase